jgi:hypothetical protein
MAGTAFFLLLRSGEWQSTWLFFTEKPQGLSVGALDLQEKCSRTRECMHAECIKRHAVL